MAKMHVEVVSTEQQIYAGEAEFLVAPAAEGEIGVYPRHVPLLTRIKPRRTASDSAGFQGRGSGGGVRWHDGSATDPHHRSG
ncbi:hypothetical protein QF022_000907 [Vogesella perlucida]|nr:hypothetical protein [Vogesella perlucida]